MGSFYISIAVKLWIVMWIFSYKVDLYIDMCNCFILLSIVIEPLIHVRMTRSFKVVFVSASCWWLLMPVNI
jgi:hypothetical protein